MPDLLKLDVKDRKLLFKLDFHGREPNSAIAKKIGLSKQGTDYKVASLLKKGVITGFYPVINIGKLGYFYCRLFIKWQNLTQEKEEEVYKELIANAKVHWIVKFDGAYDAILAMYAKNLSEFKLLSEELLEKYGTYIKEKRESIGIKVIHFQSRYLLGKQETKEIAIEEAKKETELEEIDKNLLKAVAENGRISLVELGQRLKVSSKVAAYHMRKLEHAGIIVGYRPNINHNLIGYVHYKILFHLANVTRSELIRFKSYLKLLPEVIYLVDEVGIADVDIEVMLPKTQSLFELIKKVRFFAPKLIRDYEILIADKTLKIEYVPF